MFDFFIRIKFVRVAFPDYTTTFDDVVIVADTGECVGGPCNGSGLESLKVVETGGTVCLVDSRFGEPCRKVNIEG